MNEWTLEKRRGLIDAYRARFATLETIAKRYGIAPSTIQQHVRSGGAYGYWPVGSAFEKLPMRVIHALLGEQIYTVEMAREYITHDRRILNLGKIGRKQLVEWLEQQP